jgi:hypothetical protein
MIAGCDFALPSRKKKKGKKASEDKNLDMPT